MGVEGGAGGHQGLCLFWHVPLSAKYTQYLLGDRRQERKLRTQIRGKPPPPETEGSDGVPGAVSFPSWNTIASKETPHCPLGYKVDLPGLVCFVPCFQYFCHSHYFQTCAPQNTKVTCMCRIQSCAYFSRRGPVGRDWKGCSFLLQVFSAPLT